MADPPPHERTLGEYGDRDRNHAQLAIHDQPVTINKFEISPALYRELKEIHFFDKYNEDANRHLTNFFELCETMKVDGCFEKGLRLRLFPFSLKDYAKEWLNSLSSGGSLNYKIEPEARNIIEIMTSNEQMMLYDRGGGSKSGMLELNFMDVVLAQGKLLSK
ncbi:uncharacterized protein [Cicer arietinum]|uniref:uncharacterized protein n=1 Tax=Cicer arietinum TaxID=3827 RepID=UPI00032A53D5